MSKTLYVPAGIRYGSDSLSGTRTITADAVWEVDIPLTSSQSDLTVAAPTIPFAKIRAFAFSCPNNSNIKTNSTGGDETITLVGGRLVVWDYLNGFTNPISHAVASLHLNNLVASSTTLTVWIAYNL